LLDQVSLDIKTEIDPFMRIAAIAVTMLIAVCAAAGTAHAEISDAAKPLVGDWEISNADHDKTCIVTFKADAIGSAYKVDFDKACVPNLPMLKDVASWNVGANDTVQLFDGKGRTAVEFSLVENGMYNTERPGEGVFFLQAPGTAPAPAHTADEMVGDWTITRGDNKPLCALTLSNTPVGPDAFALAVKPGCDAFVTRFGPTTWGMDRGELLLKSPRGINWRFEQNDDDKWQRVPETPDPVLLVRPE
jgi:hypothetical protein